MPPKNLQLPKSQQTLSSYFNFTPKKVKLNSTIVTDNNNNVVEENSKVSGSPSRNNLIILQDLDESIEKIQSNALNVPETILDSKEKDTTHDIDNNVINSEMGSNFSKLSSYSFKNRDKNPDFEFVNSPKTKKRRASDI
ncbi:hypothetical protein AYI69_g3144, partial [Smittium culicis]